MKEIVSTTKPFGTDGQFKAVLGVDGDMLSANVAVQYPIAKIVQPATEAFDAILDRIEKAIPGDWDKPMIEKFKVEYKQELLERLSESVKETPVTEPTQEAQV